MQSGLSSEASAWRRYKVETDTGAGLSGAGSALPHLALSRSAFIAVGP